VFATLGGASGVLEVEIEERGSLDKQVRYYTLQGLSVERPLAGSVYIEVRGGKATKRRM